MGPFGPVAERAAPLEWCADRIDAGTFQPVAARGILPFWKSGLEVERECDMATTLKQMLDAANAAVPRITPEQAREMMTKDGALVVDVRDAPEVDKSGRIAGSVHVSRGMLEFRADPESPYHDKSFSRNRTVIVYCASGGRSALSGKVLKDLGYDRVYNLGAFKDWAESGGALA